jgi:hypothetical protein
MVGRPERPSTPWSIPARTAPLDAAWRLVRDDEEDDGRGPGYLPAPIDGRAPASAMGSPNPPNPSASNLLGIISSHFVPIL